MLSQWYFRIRVGRWPEYMEKRQESDNSEKLRSAKKAGVVARIIESCDLNETPAVSGEIVQAARKLAESKTW